jgi:class 3 adenylate cyclase/tetratricopeptide (TPR) repeat protein
MQVTVRCQRCDTENPRHARFCSECGSSIQRECPRCGMLSPGGTKFCPECGAPVTSQPAAQSAPLQPTTSTPALAADRPHTPLGAAVPRAERRQLTVLFCDVVGSTELSEALDPEELRGVINAYHEASAAVIARFDGHVAQYLGDGLLVYFGFPTAHEDDAQRAVRAGLGTLEAIRRVNPDLERERGVRLAVRIGVHTGPVVIGRIGAGDRLEELALGETPNLAARLQSVAQPDTLVISQTTHRLTIGYFNTRDLGPHLLKGVAQPLLVYQVLHESNARNRLDAAGAAGLSPLSGRDAEVRLLVDRWGQTREGRGQVMLLSGEPGIGKSRLVRVLAEHVSEDPSAWMVIWLSSPYFQNTAFHPIVDMLRRDALGITAESAPEEAQRKLEGWLVQYGLPLAETMPLFQSLLSLPPDRRYPPLVENADLQKVRLMQALLHILLARAAEQPVLFVVEDLHWSDPSTLELLELLIPRATAANLLTVLTFRPEFSPAWDARTYITHLTLTRLGRGPSIQLVTWSAGQKELPPAVLEQVLERGGGDPLSLEELTKSVLESGLLRERNGQLELAGALPPLAIPMTLHDSLMARLDRLDSAKMIAQLGAALGREFSFELLQAIAPVDEDRLRGALTKLVDSELVYQSGQPPTSSYVFKHALIQETAYQTLLKSTRQEYHARIGQVLEERFAVVAETQPEVVAHHFTEAGLGEKAIPYWQRAGQRALARAANVEAIAHLTRGLEVLRALPPTRTSDQQELELVMCLAPAYMAIKGWASSEVAETCGRARDLSAKLGDLPKQFGSLWGLWTNYFLRGRLGEALDTGEQVLRLALSAGDPRLLVMAHHAVGYSHFYRGEFTATCEHAERGLALFDIETERAIVLDAQFASSAALRIMLGCSMWMLGYPDRAPDLVQAGVDLTRELKHRPSEAFALAASLLFHHYSHDAGRAHETAEQLLALAGQESFEIWSPFALIFRGWSLADRGLYDDGIAELRQGVAMWQATGSFLNQTIAHAMLGYCLGKAGRIEEAVSVLESEMSAAADRQELQFAPELYRLKGEILAQRGLELAPESQERASLIGQAEACFRDAQTLAGTQKARMLELRAATSLARLFERTGRAEEGRGVLAPVYDLFTEGFETSDLRNARVLLGVDARESKREAALPR